MERGDLLQENAKIFIPQGQALNEHAHRDVKVLIVGNPANTNCLITATHAKDLPKESFCAMTRLDHDRSVWQVCEKTGTTVQDVSKMVLWGNHSPTMFPDLTWATVKGTSALDLVGNEWYNNKFIPRIQKRGRMDKSAQELLEERKAIESLLQI